jgi:hypothetical protein
MDMLHLCVPGDDYEIKVQQEKTEEGEPSTVKTISYEVWKVPEKGKQYYLDVDPASGVDDGKHNPAGLHVSEVGSGDLCARWNGYIAPYSLGVLAGGLSRQYQEAGIDVEMKDHWGANVVRGVNAARMGHRLAFEHRELRPGTWAKEVGFDQNEETKGIIIGQIQEWLASWKAGHRYAKCPSRKVIECLLDCELDDRGKIVAGPGIAHGEDMILWGQKLRRAVSRLNREIPEIQERVQTADDRIVAMIRGGVEPTRRPSIYKPRRQPRV